MEREFIEEIRGIYLDEFKKLEADTEAYPKYHYKGYLVFVDELEKTINNGEDVPTLLRRMKDKNRKHIKETDDAFTQHGEFVFNEKYFIADGILSVIDYFEERRKDW